MLRLVQEALLPRIFHDATAAGNYAKILNYNSAGKYVNNCWGGAEVNS